MKTRALLLASLCLLASGCHKHREEAQNQARLPAMAGHWQGNGTDDTIGYFEWTADLRQEGDTVYGTYQTASAYATTQGTLHMTLDSQSRITSLVMERTQWSAHACAATLTMRRPTTTNGSVFSFYYSGADCSQTDYSGGANLRKVVSE